MTEPIKTKISGTITSASIFKKKVNEPLTYQILEMVDRAKLAKEFNGLVARIEGKTYSYITLGKFASIVFTGDLQSQLENAKHAVNAMLKKVADESLESSVQTAELTSSPLEAKLQRIQAQAKYLIKIGSESEKLKIATPSHSKRRLLTMKGCEIILSMLDAEATNPVGYWRVMKFFQVAHLIGTAYEPGDCLVGLTIENLGMDDENTKRDTHARLILGEKLSYSKDDAAYIVRNFQDKSERQFHTTYITDIGIAELIFRNRWVDSCSKICEVLDRIDANIKKLGGRGLERWGCKTSLGKKMRYIIKRNDFIHMCDRLKWEEQYRLPACEWEIREDGLSGFRAATIAWHEAQDALKRNGDVGVREKLETGSLAAVAAGIDDPFDFKFEGSNDDRAQPQAEISETLNPSAAPTGAVDTAHQPPAPQPTEKTIHQKLQEIADRANAKKREIDEAMNLEMVALFSSEQATARNARKLGMPESSPTPGAMVCGFS